MTKPRIPKALFSTALDEIATAWHKNPNAPANAEALVRRLLAVEGLAIAEGLVVAPRLSFRVFGENVVLCRLIDIFGIGGVERLLEEEAIEFVLWRPLILRWKDPKDGLFPLAAGTLNTPAHCDPAASVELGLNWTNHPREKLRRVARLAVERTWLPDEQVPHTAVAVLQSALASGRFETDGMSASTPWHLLPSDRIDHLAKLGEQMVVATVVLNAGHDFLDGKENWDSLVRASSTFESAGALHETTETILRMEGLPNIPAMLLQGVVKPEDIVALRLSDATREFREWLWSQPSPADAKAVAEKYLASMKPGTKTTEKSWFKAARVSTVSVATTAAGAGIGAAVAGVPGMVVGGALSLAASLADAFGLDRLLRGKNPRRFADEEIRPRVAELIAQQGAAGPPTAAPVQTRGAEAGQTARAKGNRHDRRATDAAERRKKKAATKADRARKAKERRKR